MDFTLGKKKYPLEFGFGFIKRLNKRNGIVRDDINLRGALPTTLPSLFMRDVETVTDYIICANSDLFEKADEVEKKVEKISSEEDEQAIEKLIDDLLDAVSEGTMTRNPFKKLASGLKKEEEKAKVNA